MHHISKTLLPAMILISMAIVTPVEAAGKKKTTPEGGAETPMPTAAPLTAGECYRLGGTVYDASRGCSGTGKACTVKRRDGVSYSACITEVN